MIDIPEIDEMICVLLSKHDLYQCYMVCKRWQSNVAPTLWRDFSDLGTSYHKRDAFYKIVLDDYKHVQGQRKSLTKYGHHIRTLPDPERLCCIFAFRFRKGQPTEVELLRHLYGRCPSVRVESLVMTETSMNSEGRMRMMSECVVPRAQHLHLDHRASVESWIVKHILDCTSNELTQLTLDIHISYDSDQSGTHQETQPRAWTNLKGVYLLRCQDALADDAKINPDDKSSAFWSQLWERFANVERLRVQSISDIARSLEAGMANHMPNLDKILLDVSHLGAERTAGILSSSIKGWKEIDMRGASFTRFTGVARLAFMEHYPTLESVVVGTHSGFTDDDMVQVLAECPKLRVFASVPDTLANAERVIPIQAETFIDGAKSWKCEASLKQLSLKITGIPRPDVSDCEVHESHPGQGREVQSRVYDRLARMTSLETLTLGDQCVGEDKHGCLELSLESGLCKLSELKALKELHVWHLWTRISVEEVRWMTEQWPRLCAIVGLKDNQEDNRGAKEWLEQNHPEIRL